MWFAAPCCFSFTLVIISGYVGITENNRVFIKSAHLSYVVLYVSCSIVCALSIFPCPGEARFCNNHSSDGYGLDHIPWRTMGYIRVHIMLRLFQGIGRQSNFEDYHQAFSIFPYFHFAWCCKFADYRRFLLWKLKREGFGLFVAP